MKKLNSSSFLVSYNLTIKSLSSIYKKSLYKKEKKKTATTKKHSEELYIDFSSFTYKKLYNGKKQVMFNYSQMFSVSIKYVFVSSCVKKILMQHWSLLVLYIQQTFYHSGTMSNSGDLFPVAFCKVKYKSFHLENLYLNISVMQVYIQCTTV
jgi:hypothetical protein